MSGLHADPSAPLRRSVYWLLIAAAVGSMVGRVLTVQSPDGRTPFLSANDRSRWCTVRSLVDEGTFAIDEVIQSKGWDTIDKVRHVDRDDRLRFYSSKPPLLPALIAGEYWFLQKATGATFADHPFYVARVLLVITNVVPLLLYFVVLVDCVERWGRTDWGRIFVVAAATWGTFLTTFAVTLNNHLPAAVSVLLAGYAAARIWLDDQRGWGLFALAGFGAAFAAVCELPALSLLVLLAAGLLWTAPRQTLIVFVPSVAIVTAAFFVTNRIAHDSWRPPYAHRQPGDNWYDYEGSYWLEENKQGVDRGEPSHMVYAANVVVGHHGILSLTPIWIFSLIGLGRMLASGKSRRGLACAVAILTLVCLAFYLGRPLQDRNYGGITSGFRWMFWFTPLWLLVMLPTADAMASRRVFRVLAVVLLAISAASAGYACLQPWSHPWIYQYWQALGWTTP